MDNAFKETNGLNKSVKIEEKILSKHKFKNNVSTLDPKRRCGILLPLSSLPSDHGIGDFGKEAYSFVDWLHTSGCTIWQVLPIMPSRVDDLFPYFGLDANCGNTMLISLQELIKDDLLKKSDIPDAIPISKLNLNIVVQLKQPVLIKAAKQLLKSTGPLKKEYEDFKKDPTISTWLEDSALFHAINQFSNIKHWWHWPNKLKIREKEAIEAAKWEYHDFMDCFMALQFLFERQWQTLRKYTNSLGIKIIGDMSIYVGLHSTDVWSHQKMFELDEDKLMRGKPKIISGMSPDATCREGRLWGTPLYNWERNANDGYSWWINRMRRAFNLYDEVCINYFRGFVRCWAINPFSKTAKRGKWIEGPGIDIFIAIERALGKTNIIAEDLGIKCGEVIALRKQIGAPGMAILQCAFDGNPTNLHLLHNHEHDQVIYTSTHNNETIVGWWKGMKETLKQKIREYFKFEDDENVHWKLISCAMSSLANTIIIPLQDVMGLDNRARMNDLDSILAKNWQWRVGGLGLFNKLEDEKHQLLMLNKEYKRLPIGWIDVVTRSCEEIPIKDFEEVASRDCNAVKNLILGIMKELITSSI